MTTPSEEGGSLVAVDVGEINTRAVLFDVVEGRYRFLAVGITRTTVQSPQADVTEGVRRAISQLEEITGRELIGEDYRIITPVLPDGSGVDWFITTMSAGPPLNVIAVGLLDDISLESAKRLVSTTYARVVDTIGLNDGKKPEERLDTILSHRPDLVVIAGGTENGATRSVIRLVESVKLACSLMPEDQRPEILYAGNQALIEEVENQLGLLTKLYKSANVRPGLDIEQFSPAQNRMAEVFRSFRMRHIPGVSELEEWSSNRLMPTSAAFARIIQFLSKVYDPSKGVLGVDVGASATSIVSAFDGEISIGVFPEYGLGQGISGFLEKASVEDIQRWVPFEVGADYVRDYIFNKANYPASLPVTEEDLAVEQALARQAIRCSVSTASAGFPKNAGLSVEGLLPWFEPIVATGSVLTQAPSYGHSLLILLDALQPTSITTIVLDQNNLSAPLGAAADIKPFLSIQVLESNAFLSLATVITPIAQARPGSPVLRMRVTYESGDETSIDIKQGTLEALPIPMGEPARLRLQPLNRADVGMGGPGRGGTVRVVGGILGIVIDARGRPLLLPRDANRRHALYKKWLWTLGS